MMNPYICTNQCILHSPSPVHHWLAPHEVGVPWVLTASISNSVGTGNDPKIIQLKLRLLLKIKPVKVFDEPAINKGSIRPREGDLSSERNQSVRREGQEEVS